MYWMLSFEKKLDFFQDSYLHTDQKLHFDSHDQMDHKMEVSSTLHHQAETISTADSRARDREQKHIS